MVIPPHVLIRPMYPSDLPFAVACTAGEGWVSENWVTLEGFFLKDPQGCLLAEEDGQPVGICIATCYEKSGFVGELIVRPEARGKGVGADLLNQAVSVLKARGVETIYLDGVLKAVQLYERNGFQKVCRSWRLSGYLTGYISPLVRRMEFSDIDQVSALDRVYFGEDRHFFLKRRIEYFPELSYVMLDGENLCGYILGREGDNWLSTGPWVVDDHAEHPTDLLQALALQARGRLISIGILDTNQHAAEIVQSLGFLLREDSPWRMAMGPSNNLGASPQCYAVGSAAKG